ncbi:chromobox protein homolog 1-like [Antechinus flavipes]|uniref:chromobox protein homolog 1-like n=1 Tax=Antechinus flavipes TaxID=38775 RepID=UPI00223611B4|nr:chromobox protein homolog 1-like [Antechinus flavipes]
MAKKKIKKKVEELQNKKEEYGPEKILDQRLVRDQVQYLVKWKGFREEESSWEPGENLESPDLIEKFLESQKIACELEEGRSKPNLCNGRMRENKLKRKKETSKKPQNLAPNLEAEKIIDADKTNEELKFLVKWKNSDKADFVPAKEANIMWPQLVISFYEERLTWKQPVN